MTNSNNRRQLKRKSFLLLGILILGTLCLNFYVLQAYRVMNYVTQELNAPVWSSSPSGSFFSLPQRPGVLQASSKMNLIDQFIYSILHSTEMLSLVPIICLWVVTLLYALRLSTRSLPDKILQHLSEVGRVKPPKRRYFLLPGLLIGATLYLTLYSFLTLPAMSVSGWYNWLGDIMWSTSPPGSFFPLPRASGLQDMESGMNLLDQIIFIVFLRSLLVFGLTIVCWILTIQYITRVIRNKDSFVMLENQPDRMLS